ncbi:hypothetical protein, partial [Halalkalibacter flavus]|uniref:hypothetical protein n=1 Tax=Halalkalibacter flavus TaxID=3090668 RepID=UPI002FC6522E
KRLKTIYGGSAHCLEIVKTGKCALFLFGCANMLAMASLTVRLLRSSLKRLKTIYGGSAHCLEIVKTGKCALF